MSDPTDWIWLAVAGLWIVFRLLPRLFRRRPTKKPAGPARPAALPDSPRPRPSDRGVEAALDTRRGAATPPPIEPR